jgi:hypothetical protein
MTVLARTAADAQRWLERWMREKAWAEGAGDIRELNYGITALRRLIDAVKALRELDRDESSHPDRKDPEPFDDQICQAIDHVETGGEDEGDSGALPD